MRLDFNVPEAWLSEGGGSSVGFVFSHEAEKSDS